MNAVEKAYRARIAKLTGKQRVSMSVGLLAEVTEMVRRKIRDEEPGLSSREVRRRVAEKVYLMDRETRRLLSLVER